MMSEKSDDAKVSDRGEGETDDPWRYRCPSGHSSLEHYPTTDSYYCQICQTHFPADELRDAKRSGTAGATQGGDS